MIVNFIQLLLSRLKNVTKVEQMNSANPRISPATTDISGRYFLGHQVITMLGKHTNI